MYWIRYFLHTPKTFFFHYIFQSNFFVKENRFIKESLQLNNPTKITYYLSSRLLFIYSAIVAFFSMVNHIVWIINYSYNLLYQLCNFGFCTLQVRTALIMSIITLIITLIQAPES